MVQTLRESGKHQKPKICTETHCRKVVAEVYIEIKGYMTEITEKTLLHIYTQFTNSSDPLKKAEGGGQ